MMVTEKPGIAIAYLLFGSMIFYFTLCLDAEKKTWDLSKSQDLKSGKVKVYRLVKLSKNLKFYMQ